MATSTLEPVFCAELITGIFLLEHHHSLLLHIFTENRATILGGSEDDPGRSVHAQHREHIQTDHQVHPGEPGHRVRRVEEKWGKADLT